MAPVDDSPILYYRGENAFLSNFEPGFCFVRGILFRFRENAFQYHKGILGGESPDDPKMKQFYQDVVVPDKISPDGLVLTTKVLKELKPAAAKKAGRWVKKHELWEPHFRVVIMQEVVDDAFNREPLRSQLLKTNQRLLREGNWWHDTFWGVCDGTGWSCKGHPEAGFNNLGIIQMAKRKSLQESQ